MQVCLLGKLPEDLNRGLGESCCDSTIWTESHNNGLKAAENKQSLIFFFLRWDWITSKLLALQADIIMLISKCNTVLKLLHKKFIYVQLII